MKILDQGETMKEVYAGPHLHAAVKCLRHGRPDNAADWINRDIGETEPESEYAAAESLVLRRDGLIEYDTIGESIQGVAGEGI